MHTSPLMVRGSCKPVGDMEEACTIFLCPLPNDADDRDERQEQIVKIQAQSLLAGSLGYNATAVDAANADSRSLRQFFDEEEDE